ncbi:MAG TPA: translesion error-prone DNA polymerase V autoproteolytic subunit [Chitinophagaceae bacterium]|jgi:DNA polymerase V|nr:translesion error-prone DNA polymerase V autoproteolytic subunit [Chitinophagaceae bacterium]
MDTNEFFSSSYKGSKDFNQWNVHTANATGFGAAADDYAERGIDLNEQLIKNKPATFFLRVNSNAMIGAGIHQGDIVIVDRSIEPKNGSVIIAVLNGELLIRRLQVLENKKRLLVPDSKKISSIEINEASGFGVWGVVTYVIHNV